MCSRCDLSTGLDWHARARHGLLVHHEWDELSLRTVRLDVAERGRAREFLLEPTTPAEPGRDCIGVLGDVLAVERVARFDPERVARTEPAGNGAAGEDAVPERDGVLRRHEQRAPLLARVSGAIDHALDAVDLCLRERALRGIRK